jgi:hypothetical protein
MSRGHATTVVCATALAAMLIVPSAGAKTKFGADLKNGDGSVTQPTTEKNCQQDANPLDSTEKCDRIAVQYQDTGAIQDNITAPKNGTIDKLKLVALHKGNFKFELGDVKGFHGSNGKGKIVDHGQKVEYKSSIHGPDYKIQTFDVNQPVDKGDYLAIKSKKTSLLKCQSGSTEQLLFQPTLPVGGPFESNLGHRSDCTLLLQAVYE